MHNQSVGLGDDKATITYYIRNRPPLATYQELSYVLPLKNAEIAHICLETGNHWRKIFNVYAKLLFELAPENFTTWQHLRDNKLLQKDSCHCLLFSAFKLPENDEITDEQTNKLHIILGKGYAEELGLSEKCTWVSEDFAINERLGVIICPYFDYRQLSNRKITQLVGLIKQLSKAKLS